MYIYKFDNWTSLYKKNISSSSIMLEIYNDSTLIELSDKKVTFLDYDHEYSFGRLHYFNQCEFVARNKVNEQITLKKVMQGDIFIEGLNQVGSGFKPEIVYGLSKSTTKISGDCLVFYIRNYPKKRKHSLVLCNVVDNTVCHKEMVCITFSIIDGNVYGIDERSNRFIKMNSNLEEEWEFIIGSEFGIEGKSLATLPIDFNSNVIVFFGHDNIESYHDNESAMRRLRNGVLSSFCKSNGEVSWSVNFTDSIDDVKIFKDKLYVVSSSAISVLEPETGKIISEIKIGLSENVDRQFETTIAVDKNYIYFTHAEDNILLIYDRVTLTLVRKVEVPEQYKIVEHVFFDDESRKHYFRLLNKKNYVPRNPILEVDSMDIQALITFEKEPEIRIDMRPDPNNKLLQELWIELRSGSLDDALRFGEIYTRDEAQRHSSVRTDMRFGDRSPTENFNGIVHFVYSGSTENSDVVREKLKIMEKRFDNWNEIEGLYASMDKKTPTRLVAEYRE